MHSKQKDTSGKQTIVSNNIEIFSSDSDYDHNEIHGEFSIEELLVDNDTNSKHWSIEELNIDLADRHDLLSDSDLSHKSELNKNNKIWK